MGSIKVRTVKEGIFPVSIYAALVPLATRLEQVALMTDIKENGQQNPITLWRGEVVDGRCRMEALRMLNQNILYTELDDELSEGDVAIWVKSNNTRRQLTATQKVMVACKEAMSEDKYRSNTEIATSWGVSLRTLGNAIYVSKKYPEYIEPLFNGNTVSIQDSNGNSIQSNKITSIYAYAKRMEEVYVEEDTSYGWSEMSAIGTHKGKEWFYSQDLSNPIVVRMLVAELANYKFKDSEDE